MPVDFMLRAHRMHVLCRYMPVPCLHVNERVRVCAYVQIFAIRSVANPHNYVSEECRLITRLEQAATASKPPASRLKSGGKRWSMIDGTEPISP